MGPRVGGCGRERKKEKGEEREGKREREEKREKGEERESCRWRRPAGAGGRRWVAVVGVSRRRPSPAAERSPAMEKIWGEKVYMR